MRKYHNVSLQGLELVVTVLLARNRQPQPTVAAGGPHAELAAGLISLPSGLLAMVCEAIVKLKLTSLDLSCTLRASAGQLRCGRVLANAGCALMMLRVLGWGGCARGCRGR